MIVSLSDKKKIMGQLLFMRNQRMKFHNPSMHSSKDVVAIKSVTIWTRTDRRTS